MMLTLIPKTKGLGNKKLETKDFNKDCIKLFAHVHHKSFPVEGLAKSLWFSWYTSSSQEKLGMQSDEKK